VTPWFAGRKALDYFFLAGAHIERLAATGLLVE
jgi:hypothetical protein